MINHSGRPELSIERSLIDGKAKGTVLSLDESLSFWGGIDPVTGLIIDTHHPQQGTSIANTLLVLPGIKGSTAGPGALLECLYAGNGPAALLLCESDTSAIIAVTAYEALTDLSIPVVEISRETAAQLETGTYWCIEPPKLIASSKS